MKHDSIPLSLFSIIVGWAWCRGGARCRRRARVKGQQHLAMFFHPLENIYHMVLQPPQPSSNVKSCELAQSICTWQDFGLRWNSWLSSPTVRQLHVSVVSGCAGVHVNINVCFDLQIALRLCFMSLQGDVGPPGAEGEQGQEGMRVSDCKQP